MKTSKGVLDQTSKGNYSAFKDILVEIKKSKKDLVFVNSNGNDYHIKDRNKVGETFFYCI